VNDYLLQAVVLLATAVIAIPLFRQLKQAAILGFLAAGILLGPLGLELIHEPDTVLHFAELGVVLMLFLLGLELSPKLLWQLRGAIFGLGLAQLFVTALIIYALLGIWELGNETRIFLACALSLSSTAFAVQLMADHKQLSTPVGRDGFAVLLFQDIAVIPLLILTAWLGSEAGGNVSHTHIAPWYWLLSTLLAILLIARYALSPLMKFVANSHVREVQIALALLLVMGSAWWMEYLGFSMGLGAFIAGVMLANSHYRHQLETDIEPFKGLLLGLFFMAIGMSMPIDMLWQNPALVAVLLAILLFAKTLILAVLAKIKGHTWRNGLLLGCLLAEGGEFAFVLLSQAKLSQLISAELAGAAVLAIGLSMVFTPWLYNLLCKLTIEKQQNTRDFDEITEPVHAPVVIAGFGRFGQIIGRLLSSTGIHFVAMDKDASHVDVVRQFGNQVYFGDVARADLLEKTGLKDAKVLVIAVDDVDASLKVATYVLAEHPHLKIIARARNRAHAYQFYALGVKSVFRETFHTSLEAARSTLTGLGLPDSKVMDMVNLFKQHDMDHLRKSVAHKDDLEKLIELSKEGRKELATLMQQDREK
jgi:monovalent cation:proton antiporter-2 (CPA2) family protein